MYLYFPVLGPFLDSQSWPWPPSLALNLCFPTLAPNLYLPTLAPDLYLPELSPNFHLPTLAPKLYFPTLGYNFITSQWPEFTHTNIFPLICTCIYCPCLHLYYRSGAWICIYLIIGSSNSVGSYSRSSNFFGTNNTNICMPILVNWGKHTEAYTHTGCFVDLV